MGVPGFREFAGNRHRFRHLRVNEIAVTALPAAVFEARALKLSEQFSYFRWHGRFLENAFQSYNAANQPTENRAAVFGSAGFALLYGIYVQIEPRN